MHIIKYFLPFVCLMFSLSAQSQLFKGGLVAGVNFSQIDGDDLAGFNKIGVSAGVIVDIYLKEKFSLQTEILFSQKGSHSSNNEIADGRDFKFALNYVEVPILFNYHDPKKMTFSGGISISRLVSNRSFEFGTEVDDFFDDAAGNFRKTDFSGIASISYRFTESFQINLKWTYTILPYFERFSENRGKLAGWYNNTATLRFVYLLSAQGEK